MTQYIDKATLVAEIEDWRDKIKKGVFSIPLSGKEKAYATFEYSVLGKVRDFLDTLEVKEVEEKFDCPNIKIKDVIEVSSRMKHIDEDLKPIADFITDYASWNLHKNEWNQPVLEVPLFRVLDALAQRGKPYCCAD